MRIALLALVLVTTTELAAAQPGIGMTKTLPLTGNGNVASPLRLAPCALNEILKWNGSLFACAADGGGVTDGDKGDVTVTSSGATWTVDPNTIDFGKQADIATARIVGRVTGGTGDPEALTGTQATTLLDVVASGTKGLAPASGGGTTNFLRADGNWVAPAGSGDITDVVAGNGLTGGGTSGSVTLDVACLTGLTCNANSVQITDRDFGDWTTTSSGTVATIDPDVVTYAKMQNVANNNRILGRVSGAGGDVEELTGAQVATITGAITGSGTAGVLPKFATSTTLNDSRVTDTGTGITINGYVAPTSYITAGNSVDAFSGAVQLNNGDLAFANTTNATATGYINRYGYLASTTQFRDLVIGDGKNAAAVTVTGSTKGVAFAGPITFNAANNVGNELTLSGTFVSNGTQTTFGNADTDYVDSRATLAVSGTNVSTGTANCTASGEAQSFTFSRSSGGSASCVIDLNRTFNSAPYCVVTNSSNKVATVYVSAISTTQVTITSSDSIDAYVWCPDRR